MATSRDSALSQKVPFPVLDLAIPALQHLWLDSSSAVIAGRVTPSEFKQHARIQKQMHELNKDLAVNDSHSSDDEETKVHKLSKEATTYQAVRGTDFIRLGNEKASVVKRFQKGFHDILASLSKAGRQSYT